MVRIWISLFFFLLVMSAPALAVEINAGDSPYNTIPGADGVGVSSDFELRAAADLSLVGMYRLEHGQNSISIPSQVQIIYKDGSKEKAAVTCLIGTPCVLPIPNTQQPPPSGSAGGGSGAPPRWRG